MITIYALQNSSRLEYITTQIFHDILGIRFFITNDRESFLQQPGKCINYSTANLGKGIQIIPHQLLFEKNVYPITNIAIGKWEQLFCFFCNDRGDIPFDLFAASFYLISRYEEYFPEKLDAHLRYNPTESILFRNNCTEIPLIDQWAYQLKELFNRMGYDTSDFRLRKYNAINTFDIDHPFAFRNKGLLINTVGLCKDLLKKSFKQLCNRTKALLHFQEDPYFNALLWIDKFQQEMKKPCHLFILLGKYEKHGKRTLYSLKRYYQYLNNLNENTTIGLHPSYSASFDLEKIRQEKEQLEQLLRRKVTTNRQHFLRMQVPDTYRQLSDLGFKEDFTLAYSTTPGFRAGTAIPFLFYDLEKNCRSSLLIRPTIVMDTTLINHLALSPEAALDKINHLAKTCRNTGGDFIMLWHNSNLSNISDKNPWIKVFIESYQHAVSLENDTFVSDL